MVPVMVSRWVGLDHRSAAANSLAAILPISLVGAATYAGHGDFDPIAAACLVPGGMIGAVAGAHLTARIADRGLALAFAALSLAAALRLVVPFGLPAAGHALEPTLPTIGALLALGLGVGLLSGLLGIGGGVVVVPALVLGFGSGQHLAQGTSLAVIIACAVSGSLAHHRLGAVDRTVVVPLAAGGVLGAAAGGLVAIHLPALPLRFLFATVVAAVAANLIWRRRRG